MRLSRGPEGVGNSGLAAAVVASAILLILTYILFTPIPVSGDAGLCLPSPNEWELPRFPGWLLNLALLYLSVFFCAAINRRFHLISTADPVLPALLVVTLACSPLTTCTLSTATLLLVANLICLYLLFDTFESGNAAQQFFVIATFISLGVTVQYAFLMMIPVYIIGGVLMKSFRIRELIAFILGLVAPFWVMVGFGIVGLDDFQFPDTLSSIASTGVDTDLFVMTIVSGIIALISVILALYNGMKLFSRNSRIRSMHLALNTLGVMTLICMLVNYNNFLAYFYLLCLWFAVQIADLFTLYEIRGQRVWALAISAALIIAYGFVV